MGSVRLIRTPARLAVIAAVCYAPPRSHHSHRRRRRPIRRGRSLIVVALAAGTGVDISCAAMPRSCRRRSAAASWSRTGRATPEWRRSMPRSRRRPTATYARRQPARRWRSGRRCSSEAAVRSAEGFRAHGAREVAVRACGQCAAPIKSVADLIDCVKARPVRSPQFGLLNRRRTAPFGGILNQRFGVHMTQVPYKQQPAGHPGRRRRSRAALLRGSAAPRCR